MRAAPSAERLGVGERHPAGNRPPLGDDRLEVLALLRRSPGPDSHRIDQTSVTTNTSTIVPRAVSERPERVAADVLREISMRILHGVDARLLHQLSLFQVQQAVGPLRRRGDRASPAGSSCAAPCAARTSRLRISSAEWASRSPVGSSATISVGIGDDRPGDAHPLLLAAGKLPRPVADAVGQAHQFQGRQSPAAAAGAADSGSSNSGNSTFS